MDPVAAGCEAIEAKGFDAAVVVAGLAAPKRLDAGAGVVVVAAAALPKRPPDGALLVVPAPALAMPALPKRPPGGAAVVGVGAVTRVNKLEVGALVAAGALPNKLLGAGPDEAPVPVPPAPGVLPKSDIVGGSVGSLVAYSCEPLCYAVDASPFQRVLLVLLRSAVELVPVFLLAASSWMEKEGAVQCLSGLGARAVG